MTNFIRRLLEKDDAARSSESITPNPGGIRQVPPVAVTLALNDADTLLRGQSLDEARERLGVVRAYFNEVTSVSPDTKVFLMTYDFLVQRLHDAETKGPDDPILSGGVTFADAGAIPSERVARCVAWLDRNEWDEYQSLLGPCGKWPRS